MVGPSSRIEVERVDPSLAVLQIDGEHDLNTSARLREKFEGLIGEGSSIVVDLAVATFIDSSILAVLLWARRRAQEQGLGFAVAVPEETAVGVRRVITVTGLDGVLPVRPSRSDAVDEARAEAAA